MRGGIPIQTFLPFNTYAASAEVLDNKRLGKQRVENLQIMKALLLPDYGWQNHPAVRMWRGYEIAFLDYQHFVCNEWVYRRGFFDTCLEKTVAIFDEFGDERGNDSDPWWMRDPNFHFSHQSNLIRKDPFYYGPLFPGVPPDLDYIWPV